VSEPIPTSAAAEQQTAHAFALRRLTGKTALVTGSTRGLGRTIAEWLARDGADVIVSGREREAVDASVAAIRALGVRSWGLTADLALVAEAHRLAEEALALVPRLDILVNNAGMSIRGRFWEVSDADFEYQINVNYRSPYVLAQHAARHMIANEIRGRIVNVSTIGAHLCHTDAAVYNGAKAAVEAMTRNMGYELGPYGITVNCVAPGAIAERPGAPPSSWGRTTERIPVGRLGRAEDIAAAVRFFCLPEAEFTTGQTLLVDGGHATRLHEG
jgi:glucose 1-dehydrogenase